jgi:hypothetical protein
MAIGKRMEAKVRVDNAKEKRKSVSMLPSSRKRPQDRERDREHRRSTV